MAYEHRLYTDWSGGKVPGSDRGLQTELKLLERF